MSRQMGRAPPSRSSSSAGYHWSRVHATRPHQPKYAALRERGHGHGPAVRCRSSGGGLRHVARPDGIRCESCLIRICRLHPGAVAPEAQEPDHGLPGIASGGQWEPPCQRGPPGGGPAAVATLPSQESRRSCHLASYQDRPTAMSTFSGTCREATSSIFSRTSSRTSSISASSTSTTNSSCTCRISLLESPLRERDR